MKTTTTLLALFAATLVAAPSWAAEEARAETKAGETKTIHVGDGKHITITVTEPAEGEKQAKPRVQVKAFRVKEQAAAKAKPGQKAKPAPKIALRREFVAGGGWLGIRITPVPAAVDAQLGLKGQGVMIGNLIKGSPADKAGLDRYDVIVASGKNQPIKSVEGFISRIGACKPGEKVALTVIRGGKQRTVAVVLGKGSGPADAKYVYEEDADELFQDQLKLHKGMLKKGPGGGWTLVSPGGKIDLPGEILKALPKQVWGDVQIHVDSAGGGKKSVKIARTVDGKTIEIEGTDGGPIVVRRSQDGKGAKAVTRKYGSAEELRKGDAEAYELYKSIHTAKDGAHLQAHELVFQPKPLVFVAKGAAGEARKLQEELKEKVENWAAKAKDEARSVRTEIARTIAPEPVKRQFEVDEQGRIHAEVREGDSAVKLTFQNADEMRKKAPKLYKAYEKLLKE